jgi:hypothetical protein
MPKHQAARIKLRRLCNIRLDKRCWRSLVRLGFEPPRHELRCWGGCQCLLCAVLLATDALQAPCYTAAPACHSLRQLATHHPPRERARRPGPYQLSTPRTPCRRLACCAAPRPPGS